MRPVRPPNTRLGPARLPAEQEYAEGQAPVIKRAMEIIGDPPRPRHEPSVSREEIAELKRLMAKLKNIRWGSNRP